MEHHHRATNRGGLGWLALGPIIGLALLGLLLKWGMMEFKDADRTVSVKGVAERDVKANLVTWNLRLRGASDDLAAAQSAAMRQKDDLIAFLLAGGLSEEEVAVAGVRVVDKSAVEYGGNQGGLRYIVEVTVGVRTANVDAVAALAQKTGEMLAAGILLFEDNSCGSGPVFSFTGLNAIKPEMIAEATKSAREAAQQFAKDSGASVGGIRSASQGYFSIAARDAAAASAEGDGGYDCRSAASLFKKVRVVTTLNYGLKD